MKTFIIRLFRLIKSLFLKLRVVVTLQVGRQEWENGNVAEKKQSQQKGGSGNDRPSN